MFPCTVELIWMVHLELDLILPTSLFIHELGSWKRKTSWLLTLVRSRFFLDSEIPTRPRPPKRIKQFSKSRQNGFALPKRINRVIQANRNRSSSFTGHIANMLPSNWTEREAHYYWHWTNPSEVPRIEPSTAACGSNKNVGSVVQPEIEVSRRSKVHHLYQHRVRSICIQRRLG